MELPPGPPSLGESPPPLPADPDAEAPVDEEVEVLAAGDHDRTDRVLADEAANRRLVATTAALALVAVAIMIGVFLLTDGGQSDTPEAAATPPLATIPTATTTAPPPEIDQADLDEAIDRATAFVAQERGLEFEEDVEVDVVSRQEYEDQARAAFDADRDDVDGYLLERAQMYQALGLWPAGSDLVSLTRELRALSTVAFYDHDEQRVVMAVPQLGPLFDVTLVNELTRALDDQHFGIDRPELYERGDESALAFATMVGGDARRIDLAYQATLSDEERAQLDTEVAAATPGLDPQAFPDIMSIEQNWALTHGQSFVQALADDGGNAAVDEAFDHPPRTTEEIAEPDTYLEGVPPLEVETPESGGPESADGVVGQAVLGWLTNLEAPLDGELAEWNGDRYVLWPQGNQICIRVNVLGDAGGMAEQLQDWAGQAQAEVNAQNSALSATTCH
jgi:hypothetical protein